MEQLAREKASGHDPHADRSHAHKVICYSFVSVGEGTVADSDLQVVLAFGGKSLPFRDPLGSVLLTEEVLDLLDCGECLVHYILLSVHYCTV
jgi:hypothetical protein